MDLKFVCYWTILTQDFPLATKLSVSARFKLNCNRELRCSKPTSVSLRRLLKSFKHDLCSLSMLCSFVSKTPNINFTYSFFEIET
jgi:hypothetical protein